MATQVNAKARDFHFTMVLDDSCNCCRKRKKADFPSDLHVYVHSDGTVSPFKIKRASRASESLSRSVIHVKGVVNSLCQGTDENPERILKRVEQIAEIELNETKPIELTLGQISRINYAIQHIFAQSGSNELDSI